MKQEEALKPEVTGFSVISCCRAFFFYQFLLKLNVCVDSFAVTQNKSFGEIVFFI